MTAPVSSSLGRARAQLRQATALVRAAVTSAVPETVSSPEAAELSAAVGELERLVSAAVVRYARRAADPAGTLAQATGTPRGNARRRIELARGLGAAPGVEQAFCEGALSLDQAATIAPVAVAAPDGAAELVALAKRTSVRELHAEAARRLRRTRREQDEVAHERRLHARRSCRSWVGADGAVRLWALLGRIDGARVVRALEQATDRAMHEAFAAGVHEPRERLAADALVALVTATGTGASGSAELVLHVDAAALRRGEVGAGEVCEVPGIGPVSLEAARSLLGEGFATVLVTDGADIRTVTSRTRVIPRRLRVALEARDPACVVPGCGASHRLEIDHWRLDFARFGPTELDNLCRLCPAHHRMKTRDGWGLTGGPGHWQWHAPRPRARGHPPP